MVKKILSAAGFVEGKTFKETRFLKPPNTTYAIFLDSYDRRGSDKRNFIKTHAYTIELYSYEPDPISEGKVEEQIDAVGLEYEKSERYWLNQEQLYQVIYSFEFIEK